MTIDFKRLDHIMLCIPHGKEEEARAFYTNVLGLTEIKDPGHPIPKGAIWFQMGDIQLHVRAEDNYQISNRHPAFQVGDINQCRQLLESNGIVIKNERPMPGKERISFRDPFGNNIELIEIL
jgi:catechol 2,3-dioxygenase-like lactoylglutathione lyase family enzyme